MPLPESDNRYVFLSLDVDDQPTLRAFRECVGRADSVEELKSLVRNSIAKNETFRILTEDEVAKLDKSYPKHLFEIGKKSGNPHPGNG